MPSAQWIFGGYCLETKEKLVLEVPDRTVGALLPIIEEQMLKYLESQIYSLQGDINYRDNQIQELQQELDEQYEKVENLQIALAQE